MTDDEKEDALPGHWVEHKNWALLHEQLEQIEDAAATAKMISLTNKPGIVQLSKVLRELSSLVGRTFMMAAEIPGYVPAQRASARAKVVALVDLAEKMDELVEPPTKKTKVAPVDMQGKLVLQGDLDITPMNWDVAHAHHKASGEIATECPHCEKETAPDGANRK